MWTKPGMEKQKETLKRIRLIRQQPSNKWTKDEWWIEDPNDAAKMKVLVKKWGYDDIVDVLTVDEGRARMRIEEARQ